MKDNGDIDMSEVSREFTINTPRRSIKFRRGLCPICLRTIDDCRKADINDADTRDEGEKRP